MRGKKKLETYVPEALEHFRKCMLKVRKHSNKKSKSCKLEVDMEGLEKAIRTLDRTDRERIEKFWGLTGGPNHSKRIRCFFIKDVAFEKMRENAILSLSKLLTIDCIVMYDSTVEEKVKLIVQKINKNGLEISDIECIKYLMAFYIYAVNGPKMSFEEDPMKIESEFNEYFLIEEYEMLIPIYEEVIKYSDNSINLKMLIDFFEMFDLKENLIIKKSLGIDIPKHTIPKGFELDDIDVIKSVSQVRKLKEKMFPHGAWDVSITLILGNAEEKVELDDFISKLHLIQKDWNKIVKFKSGERKLKTMSLIK